VTTVAGRLGHTDASTTMRIYSHGVPAADQAAATAIGGPRELMQTPEQRLLNG
jgi:integrase